MSVAWVIWIEASGVNKRVSLLVELSSLCSSGEPSRDYTGVLFFGDSRMSDGKREIVFNEQAKQKTKLSCCTDTITPGQFKLKIGCHNAGPANDI